MGTALVVLILAAVVAAIIIFLVRRKKSGKPSCSDCGTGCSGCVAKEYCDSNDDVEGLRDKKKNE